MELEIMAFERNLTRWLGALFIAYGSHAHEIVDLEP